MPCKPTGDSHLDAEIDRAMVPYRSLLPPEMQEVFEDLLMMAFTEHPVGQAILSRMRPRAAPNGSGKRGILDDAEKVTPESDPASRGHTLHGEERREGSSRGKPGSHGGGQ